jgi:hypothetical protein
VTDWLAAALIGAVGSVIGGLVGGWLAISATRRQWERDQQVALTDRSRTAALEIASWIVRMNNGLASWYQAPQGLDTEALRAEFETFSSTAAIQAIALTDDELRQRVRNYTENLSYATNAAGAPTFGRPMVDPARRHGEAVIAALEAHYRGDPLPPYNQPSMKEMEGQG